MGAIKAVIFDLGRVLVDIKISSGMLSRFGISSDDNVDEIIHNPAFRAYNEGRISPQEFHQQFCEITGFHFPYEKFTELWCSIFEPIEGMDELVQDVAARLKVNLLSDTDPLHWGHITTKWPWILREFPSPALSFQIGAVKPSPVCYRIAADKIGIDAASCIFIDDLEGNIEGAREAGMEHSFVFAGMEDARSRLQQLGVL